MSILKAGVCLNLQSDSNLSRHLWVVITDPQGDPPTVALVNLTTHKEGVDETVILSAGEHSFIKKKTVVYYQRAKVYDAEQLERAITADLTIKHRHDCSLELLNN